MKQRKKCCEIHRRCIKKHIHFEEVDSWHLQMCRCIWKRHIRIFLQGSKDWLSKIKSNTGAEKAIRQMWINGNIQVEDQSDKTTEVEMDPYEKTS